jgi:hypothetical protein
MTNDETVMPDRMNVFFDGVFSVIIMVLVLELRPPKEASFGALFEAMADCGQLRDQLSLHRDRLGQSSSPFAVSRRGDASLNLGKLRASVRRFVGAVRHRMDREHPIGRFRSPQVA